MPHTPLDLPHHLDLEQFISDEAHDLRSPFNQVVGFSKLLMNDLGAAYPVDQQKEDVGTVYRNSQRALLLMNGLIDIARLNRHEKEMNPAELEIKTLLEQSLVYWKKINPASTFQPTYQISTTLSLLFADDLFLRQVLTSFIMVVTQYVDPQGTVSITVTDEPGWCVFTVASTGKKVQPLSPLDLRMQGYLGRAMVELQGGEIRLAEETDDGASIQFALPRA
jgi:signal transduction histidine kinase